MRTLISRFAVGVMSALLVGLVAMVLVLTSTGNAGPLPAAAGLVPVAAQHAAAASEAGPIVDFGEPSASGDFGETVTFQTSFRTSSAPRRAELLVSLPGEDGRQVSRAALAQTGPETWQAVVSVGGHVVPNTRYDYRFRVVTEEGPAVGPSGSHLVADRSVDWQRLSGDHVTVWWHRGDRAFAERALRIAEDAVDKATELLGVGVSGPVDFFVYADSRDFRRALGPATRENVGGEAHPAIRTLFGLIEPRQVSSDWVEELVAHELAHLVFDDAVRGPYAYPPRWLNEGLAVWLARGYEPRDRAQVESAARAGSIIPLEGLVGQFPTRPTRFGLAYAESVSAVDFFMSNHGPDELKVLIGAIAQGESLDDAFRSAIGDDFVAFEDAWLASVGAERPEPYGPRDGEPGPVPDAWAEPAGALLR